MRKGGNYFRGRGREFWKQFEIVGFIIEVSGITGRLVNIMDNT